MLCSRIRTLTTPAIALALAAAAACGKDDDFLGIPEGTPVAIDVVQGDSQTVTVGGALGSPLILRVTDIAGHPVAGEPLTLRASGGGSAAAVTPLTDADGRITIAWTADTLAGRNTLTVTGRGLGRATAVAFGAAGAPTRVLPLAAGTRAGTAGRPLDDSLEVRVTDRYGNLVADVGVAWAVTAGGGSVVPTETVTDSTGVARSRWTLGAVGDNTATATVSGLPPGTFNATAASAVSSLSLATQAVATGLSQPLLLVSPPGDLRRFVVEQTGRVRILQADGTPLAQSFLDITSKVSTGGERGLLGLAFHPQYAQNRRFYVSYTDLQGDSRIEAYQTSAADATRADITTASLILFVAQPFPNHNGGMIAFGPDGKLYVGLGDGGSGGDPFGHGQNLGSLLGKLLRIDVDGASPYTVPGDNPFVGRPGVRPEIWALGLRNPWRFSFDRTDGLLYVADVGQDLFEEVNVVPTALGGVNYGWNIMEASSCYGAASCNRAGLTLPVVEYGHGAGCSVTGGFVYRGQQIPELVGHYLYSDFCSGFLRSFRYADGRATEQRVYPLASFGNVTSFGEDSAGELYVLTSQGRVLNIVRGG